jgi:hypothetical protein
MASKPSPEEAARLQMFGPLQTKAALPTAPANPRHFFVDEETLKDAIWCLQQAEKYEGFSTGYREKCGRIAIGLTKSMFRT